MTLFNIRIVLLLLLLGLVNTGCATMFASKKPVIFESEPSGATVRIQGKTLGQTPFTAVVEGSPVVEFQLAGYQTRFLNPALESQWRIEPWFWANILNYGIGGIVDICTDNCVVLKSPVSVSLYPVNEASQPIYTSPVTASQGTSVGSTASVGKGGPEDKLFTLKNLKEKGLISDEEYERKRAEILNAL